MILFAVSISRRHITLYGNVGFICAFQNSRSPDMLSFGFDSAHFATAHAIETPFSMHGRQFRPRARSSGPQHNDAPPSRDCPDAASSVSLTTYSLPLR
jgi:hypothetical protein